MCPFRIRQSLVLALIALPGAAAQSSGSADDAVTFSNEELKRILQHSPLGPLPPDPTNRVADTTEAVLLGQFLFFDQRLSANGEIACATCHDPAKGFADAKEVGEGLATVTRNSPAVWNMAYNRWYYWDGRKDTLWSQALNPIEQGLEMGGSRLGVAHLIADDADLRNAYEQLFAPMPDLNDGGRFPPAGKPLPQEPLHPDHVAWLSMTPADQSTINRIYTNVGKCIAAYERRLISRQAPFDIFVEGLRTNDARKQQALSPAARRGLKLFIGRGNCRLCHAGPNFTDGEFHNIGVPPRAGGMPKDAGRYEGIEQLRTDPFNAASVYSDQPQGRTAERLSYLANLPENWGRFKTPSLRNVALTAPYMHQGQFKALRDVLHYYSTLEDFVQLGHHRETILKPLDLSEDEINDLIAFLNTLTDEKIDPALKVKPASALLETESPSIQP